MYCRHCGTKIQNPNEKTCENCKKNLSEKKGNKAIVIFGTILLIITLIYIVRTSDTDKDGLIHYQERIFGTDNSLPDTDSDGLSDGEEIYKYHTYQLSDDTDLDGLLDGEEVNETGTDPDEADTDGDGIKDGDE